MAVAHRSAVADSVGTSPCRHALSASDCSHMPAEAVTAGAAYQQATERIFTGVSTAADRCILFFSTALHLCLLHVKHLLRDDRRMSVLCVVHRGLAGILHSTLG